MSFAHRKPRLAIQKLASKLPLKANRANEA